MNIDYKQKVPTAFSADGYRRNRKEAGQMTDKEKCPYPNDLKLRFEDSPLKLGYACENCTDPDCIHSQKM